MMTQLLLFLILHFGGLGLPVQIGRVEYGEIFYGFGHTHYYGDCMPSPGPAYAQQVNLLDHHIFTVVRSGDCAVAVKGG
jgi:hypothetical protein